MSDTDFFRALFDTLFHTRQQLTPQKAKFALIGLEYFRMPAHMRLDQMPTMPWWLPAD